MKNALIGMLALMPAITWAQQKPFTITASFGPGITKAVLNRYTLSTGQHKDTASVTDGKAVFKGLVNSERQIGQITVMEGNSQGSAIFYLEPGKINVSFPYKGGTKFLVVSGTPLNRDYQVYRDMINKMMESANAGNTGGRPISEFDPLIQDQKFDVISRFISAHRSSPINVDLLNQIGIGYKRPELLLREYDKLTAADKKSPEGNELFTRIKGMGAAKVGDMAPAFTVPDTEDKQISLADYKGKYVLIDFWATWCAPCMQEMPNLIKVYDQYKNKNFEILGVSLDRPDSKERWLKTISGDNLSWKQVSDLKWWNSTPALLYNITSVPASFLVDPAGKIIATNLRGEELQKKLAEVLL